MNQVQSITMAESNGENVNKAVDKYGKKLLGFLKKKVSSSEEAEDIFQEVWFQLSSVANFNDIQNISSWLYSVAKNKIIDSYRKQKPDSYEDAENAEGSFKDFLLMDEDADPEQGHFKALFWDELMRALDELPANQRVVFVQNELNDLTLKEIAEQTGVPLKTVISRKGYAVKHLREKLNYLYKELQH